MRVGSISTNRGLTELEDSPNAIYRRRHEGRGVPQGTMTTHTYSAQKLNIAKLRHSADVCVLVVPFWGALDMPEAPALREVDL